MKIFARAPQNQPDTDPGRNIQQHKVTLTKIVTIGFKFSHYDISFANPIGKTSIEKQQSNR